ncbi:twin transmembrane helix small protein [Lichenicoccus roseus]|uniref:Twin transmembrane helix small protein n=1 Tax=Lichenicoccus roseus TaxID=2683649 RepID=A0A5R9J9G6_9PROT|nr:twin transmembrane helix small protein [Lichenicoccus roseus]TLU72006.1 twin transmembrane helix small protein [Lichenicoccus roseus]
MRTLLTLLMVFAMIGTVGVLAAGVVGFVRGGGDPRRSNRLMRWRVILQASAILLFVLLLTIFRR